MRTAPFNMLRMLVFAKSYEYNHNEPEFYPFERSLDGKSDFSRPNPTFFAHLKKRILDLQALDIQAKLILFHPYDRWGYSSMPSMTINICAIFWHESQRLRNVWWCMANELDLMHAKTVSDFDRFFQLVKQYDAYNHLRSIHYSHTQYDYSHPWVTYASLQTGNFGESKRFREEWSKPIVYDEVGYEGNLNRRWGCMSGEEMTRRVWNGVLSGCYVTHGETYLPRESSYSENSTPILWWSTGGTLHGTSPSRIAFLKKLTEEMMKNTPLAMGWNPSSDTYYLNSVAYSDTEGKHAQTILYYFDLISRSGTSFLCPQQSSLRRT